LKTAALVIGLLPALAMAQAPVIEISGANFRPLPIAVPAPQSDDGSRSEAVTTFDAAFMFDLSAAGIFQVLDRKSFIIDPKEGMTANTIRFNRWADVGAEALVKTRLSVVGDRLTAELHRFTVGTGKEDFSTTQAVPVQDARRLAHIFADALYKSFTRESGPFQTHLAYVRKSGHNKEVWISDWDGNRGQAVANDGLNVLPALVPNTSSVAFTSYRGGKPEIYVARPGSRPTQLVKSPSMITGVAFSPDGRRLAYAQASGEGTQIWVAAADGGGARQLTNTEYFINSSPSWAPDGRRIAFVSNRGGSPQIYIMTADGSEARRITFQGNYNTTPSWSARGDLIAFTARDEFGTFDIFTVNVDTGKVIRLTQNQGSNEEPTFSPNGRLVIFSSTRSGESHLYVMTPDGHTQLALPMDKGSYYTPDWGR
jgi:TolB protein